MGVFLFHVFYKESSCFCFYFLLHAHFDICRYLMILCHFDKMNEKMMFFFLLNQYSCHCNATRLVTPNYVLIVYDWLWLCKSFVEAFEL